MGPVRMNKVEAAIRLAVVYNKAINNHDTSKISELISEDCILEPSAPPPKGSQIVGKREILEYWRTWFAEHPGLKFLPVAAQNFGNQCIIRWKTESSTMGYEQETGLDLFTVSSGKITEIYSYMKGEFNQL